MNDSKLLSIQVGLPADHTDADLSAHRNPTWQSGIFKFPVSGRVHVGKINLAGDGQADLRVHGGEYRAALAYSAEHYDTWRAELDRPDFPFGAFGENLTVTQLDENTVYMGDVYQIGDTVRLQVTQPRMPCWKLARRHDIKDLAARVEEKNWGGWYHRVLVEGEIEAGMPVTLIERVQDRYTIAMTVAVISEKVSDDEVLRRAAGELAEFEFITPRWRMQLGGIAASEPEAR